VPEKINAKLWSAAQLALLVFLAVLVGFGVKVAGGKFFAKKHISEPWRDDPIIAEPCPEGVPKWECAPIVKPAK